MTVAALCFALMNGIIREVSQDLHPFQIAFFRNFFALLFMLPWLMRAGISALHTKHFSLHLLRAAVGLSAMLCWFSSIALLPLAEAVALNFTVPLFATIGAALVLHEVVRARRWTATAIGLLGVIIILRPGFAEITAPMALPIIAAVFMAAAILIVKTLSRHDDAGTMVLYMNLITTPLSLVLALFFWRWPDFTALLWLMLLGSLAALAHLAFTRSCASADASAVIPFDYMRLPFVALIGYFAFGEVPDLWTWVGAGVIAASAIYIARRETQVARERKSSGAASQTPVGRL